MNKYAEIIIDNNNPELDNLFTYMIPKTMEEEIKVGMRVVIPFGRGNKMIKGIIIKIKDSYSGKYRLKNIVEILDDKPIISENLIELALWMREEYLSYYLTSLRTVMPPGDFKEVETLIVLKNSNYDYRNLEEAKIINYLSSGEEVLLSELKSNLKILNINKHLNVLEKKDIIDIRIDISTRVKKKEERWIGLKNEKYTFSEMKKIVGKQAYKQQEILKFLYENGDTPINKLAKELNTTNVTIAALEDKQIANIYFKTVERKAIKREIENYEKHDLNESQESILRNIVKSSNKKPFLIHGVTGSGKTEIYLQLVEEKLKKGLDSIILVPEISLTPQTIDRFVGRFGEEVAVLHSQLSQGERFDQWRNIKEGKVKIAVGARSAIFAPFNNLGLIIIDEEHENTYKSSQNPKYDTIEVAEKRSNIEGAKLVMGTATPSVNIYHRFLNNEIIKYNISKRINNFEMPEINLVDMREELSNGNNTIFSKTLYNNIKTNLKRKKQTILFLNRKGFSTFVSCRQCGYVVRCNNCDISMTYYQNTNRLRCHYCGETKINPKKCPECGSGYIKHFGVGTEQVEKVVKETFPSAIVARLDGDTSSKKDAYDEILGNMKKDKIDILIGTQMISKGLDFKNVTLVGIIAADTSLNLPDYKSAENTFQLITQVSGRAGRGEDKGKVILQTYEPEHYSIVKAKEMDYSGFMDIELPIRKAFLYPPYVDLINLIIEGEIYSDVIKKSNKLYNLLGSKIYQLYGESYHDFLIGPNPAALERIKGKYRYQIIIKSKKEHAKELKRYLYRVCISNEYNLKLNNIKLNLSINPVSIL